MRNKFLMITLMLVIAIFSLGFVNAEENNNNGKFSLFDINAYEDVYKLSEQGEKIDLPFLKLFGKSASYDKLVTHSGISLGQSTIDVNEKLEGIQVIFTNDMVTINGEIEHGIIYGNNVVINGKISGDSVIIAANVKILDKAVLSGDTIIVSNNLEFLGTANENVIAVVSADATISGSIEKDLRIITNGINLENSNIKGNVYIKTDADTSKIKEKYNNAVVAPLTKENTQKKSSNILDLVIKGIITVVVYAAICYFLTRKEGNIVEKATAKFKEHYVYGIVGACIYFLLMLILPIVLILLVIIDLGIIAWPILIVYVSILLLSLSISTLVVGMVIYQSIKSKVEKWKLPAILLIFTLLFVLSNIAFISYYVLMAINLVSLAVIITMITKKQKRVEVK